jgi:ATP-dependent DNA ligase
LAPPIPRAAPDQGLPADLVGPVELELAKAVPTLPGPHAVAGGTRWELKFDGFRAALVRGADTVRIWSRNKTDMTLNFPEIASAARIMLPPHSVCDGELVSWNGDRMSFDRLQQRLAIGPARARALAANHPASYVVFDLLAGRGADLRGLGFDDRRAALEALATWSPPMQLSPITDDFDTAKNWVNDYPGTGIEGLVAKGATTTYRGGFRGWQKFNSVGMLAARA